MVIELSDLLHLMSHDGIDYGTVSPLSKMSSNPMKMDHYSDWSTYKWRYKGWLASIDGKDFWVPSIHHKWYHMNNLDLLKVDPIFTFHWALFLKIKEIHLDLKRTASYFTFEGQHLSPFTCCDCSEPLLTSSIPNLQFNSLAIKLNGSYLKINAAKGEANFVRLEKRK